MNASFTGACVCFANENGPAAFRAEAWKLSVRLNRSGRSRSYEGTEPGTHGRPVVSFVSDRAPLSHARSARRRSNVSLDTTAVCFSRALCSVANTSSGEREPERAPAKARSNEKLA